MIEIIEASEEHIPEIIGLFREFMAFNADIDHHDTMSEDGPARMEERLEKAIDSPDSLVLVTLDNGHAVGYSLSGIVQRPPFFRSRTLGFVYDMAVTAGHRRQGFGAKMLDRILAWFKSRNVDRIETSVVNGNEISNAFWRKHAFKDYEQVLYLTVTEKQR